MNGHSHKAIGIAVGIGFAIANSRSGQGAYALIPLITAPIGAMTPDIDHAGSTYGRTRKAITDSVTHLTAFAVFGFAAFTTVYAFFYVSKFIAVICAIVYGALSAGLMSIKNNKYLRKRFHFLAKHRGVMHTFLVPALTMSLALIFANQTFYMLMYGFVLGYISHLGADTCTSDGTPLFWPLTERPISLLPIVTGTIAETICCAIICGGIICLSLAMR